MTLTFDSVTSHIRHTLGGDVASSTDLYRIVNDAGDYMATMHPWRWLEDVKDDVNATSELPYILLPSGFIELLEANSLKILPDIADRGNKYHIVLIDGDHNYATVSKELQYASKMVYSNGIIVCDDYHGQGGSQNEYRSDDLNFYDGEKVNLNVENLITRQNDESISKAGVKAAVDEFLYHNKEWASIQIYEKEPVLLYQPEHVHFSYKNIDPNDEEKGKNITWEFKGAANV